MLFSRSSSPKPALLAPNPNANKTLQPPKFDFQPKDMLMDMVKAADNLYRRSNARDKSEFAGKSCQSLNSVLDQYRCARAKLVSVQDHFDNIREAVGGGGGGGGGGPPSSQGGGGGGGGPPSSSLLASLAQQETECPDKYKLFAFKMKLVGKELFKRLMGDDEILATWNKLKESEKAKNRSLCKTRMSQLRTMINDRGAGANLEFMKNFATMCYASITGKSNVAQYVRECRNKSEFNLKKALDTSLQRDTISRKQIAENPPNACMVWSVANSNSCMSACVQMTDAAESECKKEGKFSSCGEACFLGDMEYPITKFYDRDAQPGFLSGCTSDKCKKYSSLEAAMRACSSMGKACGGVTLALDGTTQTRRERQLQKSTSDEFSFRKFLNITHKDHTAAAAPVVKKAAPAPVLVKKVAPECRVLRSKNLPGGSWESGQAYQLNGKCLRMKKGMRCQGNFENCSKQNWKFQTLGSASQRVRPRTPRRKRRSSRRRARR